jgi:hypothetical protein
LSLSLLSLSPTRGLSDEDVVPAPDFLHHDTILNVAEQHEELLPVVVNKDLKEGRPSCLLAGQTCSAKNRFSPITEVDCPISVSVGQSASDSVPYSGSGISTPAADGSTSRTQVMCAPMSYSGNEVNDRRQSLLGSYLIVKEGDRVRVTLPLQGPFGAVQDREGVQHVWCHLLDGTHEAGWLPESILGMGDATEALQTLNRNKEQLEVIAKRLAALCELSEGTLSHQARVNLTQVEAELQKLQEEGIDSVRLACLGSGRDEAAVLRKKLANSHEQLQRELEALSKRTAKGPSASPMASSQQPGTEASRPPQPMPHLRTEPLQEFDIGTEIGDDELEPDAIPREQWRHYDDNWLRVGPDRTWKADHRSYIPVLPRSKFRLRAIEW